MTKKVLKLSSKADQSTKLLFYQQLMAMKNGMNPGASTGDSVLVRSIAKLLKTKGCDLKASAN